MERDEDGASGQPKVTRVESDGHTEENHFPRRRRPTTWDMTSRVIPKPERCLIHVSVAECARLFRSCIAASIERKADPVDAQGLSTAVFITSQAFLPLGFTNNKVEHIDKELSGVHIATEHGLR